MFLEPNAEVVVLSVGDDPDDTEMEMGILLNHDGDGVVLKTTHRMEIQTILPSSEDRAIALETFEGMTAAELRRYARANGLDLMRSVLWKTERIRNACFNLAVANMEQKIQVLRPLMRPVEQWISYSHMKRIIHAAQFIEEKNLQRLDFDVDLDTEDTESYTKSKTEDSEK